MKAITAVSNLAQSLVTHSQDTQSQATHSIDTETSQTGEWILRSYHEMADHSLVETDLLSDFRANLQLLAELQGRTSFVMKEVRYILKLSL